MFIIFNDIKEINFQTDLMIKIIKTKKKDTKKKIKPKSKKKILSFIREKKKNCFMLLYYPQNLFLFSL